MQDSVVNRMADFNAEDVESIEVLKAPPRRPSTARRPATAVIINTKRGQAGPPAWT